MAKKATKAGASKSAASKVKYVYTWGAGKADGNGSMKALLGGKGANLAEMSRIGLPVPAAVTRPAGDQVRGSTGRATHRAGLFQGSA